MNAKNIIEVAGELITGDRAKQYGPSDKSFANIAALWSCYFGVPFTGHDVAMAMLLLKISRIKTGAHNPDNYVDLVGYAAIAAELSAPGLKNPTGYEPR